MVFSYCDYFKISYISSLDNKDFIKSHIPTKYYLNSWILTINNKEEISPKSVLDILHSLQQKNFNVEISITLDLRKTSSSEFKASVEISRR